MSASRSTSKASRETIQTIHNISKTLNLKFNAEQIEALIGIFEVGADPDCVMRFLSENCSNLQPPEFSMESFTPSTSVPRRSNVTQNKSSLPFTDKKTERFDPN